MSLYRLTPSISLAYRLLPTLDIKAFIARITMLTQIPNTINVTYTEKLVQATPKWLRRARCGTVSGVVLTKPGCRRSLGVGA